MISHRRADDGESMVQDAHGRRPSTLKSDVNRRRFKPTLSPSSHASHVHPKHMLAAGASAASCHRVRMPFSLVPYS